MKDQKVNKPVGKPDDRRKKEWQLYWLTPIKDALPLEWQTRYSDLIGELKPPDELLGHIHAWSGPTSPKYVDELRSMEIPAIVSYLKTWQPIDQPMSPSPEGLGRELSKVAASDPKQFAESADQFRGLDATYVRALLQGLTSATKEHHEFPWQQVP